MKALLLPKICNAGKETQRKTPTQAHDLKCHPLVPGPPSPTSSSLCSDLVWTGKLVHQVGHGNLALHGRHHPDHVTLLSGGRGLLTDLHSTKGGKTRRCLEGGCPMQQWGSSAPELCAAVRSHRVLGAAEGAVLLHPIRLLPGLLVDMQGAKR